MIEWIAVAAIISAIVYAITIYNYLVRDRQRTRAGLIVRIVRGIIWRRWRWRRLVVITLFTCDGILLFY
jgi:hypothetical protein